jgi:hypothetical protein
MPKFDIPFYDLAWVAANYIMSLLVSRVHLDFG